MNKDILTVDFDRQPELHWEQKICPFCSECVGPDSNCEKIDSKEMVSRGLVNIDEDDDLSFNKTINLNGNLISIFSPNCHFKKFVSYELHINYPISKTLAMILSKIDGVEFFQVQSRYRATVTFCKLFSDVKVRKKIEDRFREYINEKIEIYQGLQKAILEEMEYDE